MKLVNQEWLHVEFEIPDSEGELIDEVGIVLEAYSTRKPKSLGTNFHRRIQNSWKIRLHN